MKHLVAMFLLPVLAGCQQADTEYRQCDVLERCVNILIPREGNPDSDRIQASLNKIRTGLVRLDEMIHPWRSGGMKRLNSRLASGEWSTINPSVIKMVKQAQELSRLSNGLYNPALYGALLKIWGFHRETPLAEPPSRHAIRTLLARKPSMSDVELEGIRVRSRNVAVLIQFGTLLDARIIETITRYLDEDNISHALVQARETIYARGRYKGKSVWPVSSLQPRDGLPALASIESGGAVCRLVLTDLSAQRIQGNDYRAIFNPASGLALDRTSAPATAVMAMHTRPDIASAACMALLVTNNKFEEIATRMGLSAAWRMRGDAQLERYSLPR